MENLQVLGILTGDRLNRPPDLLPNFLIYHENEPDHGEDAKPILLLSPGSDTDAVWGVVGVFDGMGGAGAHQYETESRVLRTGAFIASRAARDAVQAYFRDGPRYRDLKDEAKRLQMLSTELHNTMSKALEAVSASLPSGSTQLAGKLVRTLPTTAALFLFEVANENDGITWYSFGAGDSRCYLLTKAHGLQQVTRDDLKSEGDALHNLLDDSPISNCVNASEPFEIKTNSGALSSPAVIIAATDGCFDYYQSPAHFEHALLSTLQVSSSYDDWRCRLTVAFVDITGDDVSMALVCIGCRRFCELQDELRERLEYVVQEHVQPLNDLLDERKALERMCKRGHQTYQETRLGLWDKYRATYEMALATSGRNSGA